MSFILKSDALASKSITDIFGINGPNDYAAMLDFELGKFLLRNAQGQYDSVTMSDVLSFSRNGPTYYYDRKKGWLVADKDVPVIHYDKTINKSGLLIESNQTYVHQILQRTFDPLSETKTIPYRAGDMICYIAGTGSVTISGDVINKSGSNNTVTEGFPEIFLLQDSGNGTSNITITVTGDVHHAYFGNGKIAGTPFVTDITVKQKSIASLKQSIVQKYLQGERFTIITDFNSAFGNQEGTLFSINNGSGGEYRGFHNNSLKTTGVNLFQTGPLVVSGFIGKLPDNKNVLAFSSSNRGEKVVVTNGGLIHDASKSINVIPENFLLGQDEISANTLNGIISRLAIYDRLLSRDELISIAAGWNSQ